MSQKKENNNNNSNKSRVGALLALLLLLILCVSIGYAALTQRLTATGTTKVAKVNWDIHFENPATTEGSVACAPTLSDSATLTYNPTLANPGDYCEFTVDVKNGGTIPAKLSKNPVISSVNASYLEYTATYADGTTISANDPLDVGAIKKVKIRVEFKKDITSEQLPDANATVELQFSMDYIQA